MTDIVCAVDPGHGGRNKGARSPDYRAREEILTLRVARRARELDGGLILTRSKDITISYQLRARLARARGVDLVVLVHFDSAPQRVTRCGVDAYYYRSNPVTRSLAKWAVEHAPPQLDGGRVISSIEATDAARNLLTVYPMDALLLEMGFLSNPRDYRFLTGPDGIDACARHVVACCCEYRKIIGDKAHGNTT